MPTGRQVRAIGRKYVINLANKGQIRRSPVLGPFHKCMTTELNEWVKNNPGKSPAGKAGGFASAKKTCESKKVGKGGVKKSKGKK